MRQNRRRRLADDCFLTDSDRMTHAEVLTVLRERLSPVVGTETVALAKAGSRVLAETVAAPRDIPAYDNAAVDGFAFASADYGREGARLPVVMRIAAGDTDVSALPRAAAARIFTGAAVPAGADTVAMQEDCELEEATGPPVVIIPAGLKKGANRRRAGEDVAAGQMIAEPGDRLRPQDVAAIASTGRANVSVFSRLKIGVVSSGNELRRPGDGLDLGQVYDSNHFLLRALLAPIAGEMVDLGVLPDRADETQRKVAEAAQKCDVVLTTGGASKGEEDHLVAALDNLGKRHLWQIAVKPGRPMSFGQVGDTTFFCLPGNPVAAFVCFLLYVRPALILLGGGKWREPQRFPVPAGFSIPKKKTGRREFWRGWLEEDVEGNPVARKFDRDGSGLISGLRQASGLIEVGEDIASVAPGDHVRFIPFSEFGIV